MTATTASGHRKLFKCYECNRDIGSASALSKHFKLFPDHRNEDQQRKHDYQRKYSARVRRQQRREALKNGGVAKTNGKRRKKDEGVAFCTECGNPRGITDKFCAFCGHEH
jgi:hypothetical protein